MKIRDLFTRLDEAVDVNSPEFRRWFGASKIVDANGQPLRLFRGLYGPHAAEADRMEGREGYAAFFTTSPYKASSYASPDGDHPFAEMPHNVGAVYPVYIRAETLHEFPVKVDGHGYRWFDKFAFDDRARRLRPGEALVVRQVTDAGPRSTTQSDPDRRATERADIYAIGKGTSVKSAVSNSGAFSDDGMMTEGAKLWR